MNLDLEFALKVMSRIWMLGGDSKYLILNGYWWKPSQFIMVFPLNFINASFRFSELWSDVKILACNFLSKCSSEDGFSKVIVSTSFLIGPDWNSLNLSWYFPLNFIIASLYFQNLDQMNKYCGGICSQSDI